MCKSVYVICMPRKSTYAGATWLDDRWWLVSLTVISLPLLAIETFTYWSVTVVDLLLYLLGYA